MVRFVFRSISLQQTKHILGFAVHTHRQTPVTHLKWWALLASHLNICRSKHAVIIKGGMRLGSVLMTWERIWDFTHANPGVAGVS